jgi:uncharacterized protein (TIGR02246 family)
MTDRHTIATILVVVTLVSVTGCTGVRTKTTDTTAEVQEVLDRWAKAFRDKDIEGIMAVYAAGNAVVAYDIVPPLQYRGKDAYRKSYVEFLDQYTGAIELEVRDPHIAAGNDVAFIHALERVSGTLKSTRQHSDLWMRATSGLRKIDGKWLIVHDHISAPVDFATGKAVLDLKP